MLKYIRIQNFKAISDAEFNIRPLTLLMGPNSGGKSSIIQPLLLLRQTVDSRDMENPLAIHGKYMDFGSYRDFIFRQNDREHLRFTLRFQRPQAITPWRKETSLTAEDMEFGVEFQYLRKSMRVIVSSAYFELPNKNLKATITRLRPDKYALSFVKGSDTWNSEDKGAPFKFNKLLKFYNPSVDLARSLLHLGSGEKLKKAYPKMYSFINNVDQDEYYKLIVWAPSTIDYIFNRLFYIGPLRESPKRFYIASGETPQDVGLRGELAVETLWRQSRSLRTRKSTFENINEWLRKFELASEISLKAIGSNTYELRLKDANTNLKVNLADVGFGASQVLPIIVEGFYAPFNSILLIEQPEIHLHPRAQATLADLLITIAKRGITLLVETHSEHLVARIQRRIAEGILESNETVIYYCQGTPDGTKISEIQFDELGNFKEEGIPEGFFEEDFKESLEHLQAIRKRVKVA